MKIGNCSIAKKTLLLSIISLTLVVFTALWTYYLSTEVRSLAVLAEEEAILTRTAHQIDKDVIQIQQWLTDISATRGLDGLDDGFEQAENSYQSCLSGLSIFENQYVKNNDEERLGEINHIRQLLDEYYLSGKQMADAYIKHGPIEGNKSMTVFDERAEILSASLKPFIDHHYDIMLNELKNVSGSVSLLMKSELVIFMLIGFSIVASAFILLRAIVTHMRKSQSIIERLARGELTDDLKVENGKDEMGRLMGSLGELYQRLQMIVCEVNGSSDRIRDTAHGISSDNEHLSEMAAKQASILNETTESMALISESVRHNAEQAQKASELATNATAVAREGALAITNTIGSMGQVDDSSKKISERRKA